MSGISVTVEGVSKVTSNLRKICTRIPIGAKEGIDDSLKVLKTQGIENLRNTTININPRAHGQTYGAYTHKKINQSWHRNEAQIAGDVIEGTLYNDSDHAGMVEGGTADVIVPTGDKPLKFKVGPNQWVQTMSVRGQPPKAFLRNAMLTHKTNIPNIISNAIKAQLVTI